MFRANFLAHSNAQTAFVRVVTPVNEETRRQYFHPLSPRMLAHCTGNPKYLVRLQAGTHKLFLERERHCESKVSCIQK